MKTVIELYGIWTDMDFCGNMLSKKNSQKLLGHSKKSVTDPTKTTSKK